VFNCVALDAFLVFILSFILTFKERELGEEFVKLHQGPTDCSNWLVTGRILMSAYPGDISRQKALLKAKQLVDANITLVACLQEKSELVRFQPYEPDILLAHKNANLETKIEFINFGIPDYDIADDDLVDEFTDDLVKRFHDGENILLHCWGGHGRTGTIAAVLLCKLYDISADESLKRVQAVHDCRVEPRGTRSPQSTPQFQQVKRLAKKYLAKMQIPDSKPRCQSCNKSEKTMFKCSRCKITLYCSADCQRTNWKVHKVNCKNGML
jgi:protein-tyrosine phosphatase